MDTLTDMFESLLELFNTKNKTMGDPMVPIYNGGAVKGWKYYSYYTGIICGAKIHLERKQSYETYIIEESFEFAPHEVETINTAKVRLVTESNILYKHLETNLKTESIDIDTEKIKLFIDAVDYLNDIYYNITDIQY